MTPEAIIALVSFSVFLLIQTAIFGYYAGKVSGRLTSAEEDIKDNHQDLNNFGNKLDTSVNDMFVSNAKCSGINKQWEIKVGSLLRERDIYNAQNSTEHKALLNQGKEVNKALLKISECLHKLQNNKDCD